MTDSFRDVVDRYQVVFLDSYGVLKTSAGLLPGAMEAVRDLIEADKRVYILTNDASKSPAAIAHQFRVTPDDAPLVSEDRILSSGLLARDYLANKVRSGAAAYMGKAESAHYLESAGLEAIPVGQVKASHDVKALVLLDDEGFDWASDINAAINLVIHRHLPVIVANTDLSYPVSGNRVAVAIGGIAHLLQKITQKHFVRFGKPDAMMFDMAFDAAQRAIPDLSKRDVVMVGDTLGTDIMGANKFGIDSVLTLSGNTPAADVHLWVNSLGIRPDYVVPHVAS